jgi:hypothetical protein
MVMRIMPPRFRGEGHGPHLPAHPLENAICTAPRGYDGIT